MSTRQPITVIGGGIAGLALAACLPPDRFEVTLVEQRDALPATGTSLAIWEEAQAALERLGVLDALRTASPVITRFPIRRGDGRILAATSTEPSPVVSRLDLLQALEAAVPAGVRRVRARVDERTDLDALGGAPGALVIGADGVHSAVRRAHWGAAGAAIATPYLAVRGVIGRASAVEAMGEYWARGRLYGVGPHRLGTNWYAAFRSDLGPRNVDVAEALAAARRDADRDAGLAPAVADVLHTATADGTLAQRIHVTPRLRSYVRDRYVLVGDAAHAMTPNLGRGAGEALVDATTLAALLADRPVEDALAAYDAARCRRTTALAAASALLMRVALAERMQPLRDGALAVAGRGSRRRAGTADPTQATRRADQPAPADSR
ncbi:NAD(P)-binding protein [Agromyces sp. CFH 90414]|uniref:NAD(P)-binding protein n=1 Tax=Agromyces agglutinans TaxID=2662258 RepID=A0A6I2F8S4_9MICO|nr:FAD-dependent monooxygenase [Agromyces agglutinans]MRG61252.1 NAD(P)-binding protein [Agromyces agglutinans]